MENDMPEVIINGPEGRLEGRYFPAKVPNSPIALLLHPHPQHGGTMNNKVVYQLYQMFVRRGFADPPLQFPGPWAAVRAALTGAKASFPMPLRHWDWLQSQNQDAPMCWVAGFSFGAWIGMQLLMRRPEITGFVSVSPPANMYDFLVPRTLPGIRPDHPWRSG